MSESVELFVDETTQSWPGFGKLECNVFNIYAGHSDASIGEGSDDSLIGTKLTPKEYVALMAELSKIRGYEVAHAFNPDPGKPANQISPGHTRKIKKAFEDVAAAAIATLDDYRLNILTFTLALHVQDAEENSNIEKVAHTAEASCLRK